jgi:hypothetical protein
MPSIIDSYSESNQDATNFSISSPGNHGGGQSFTGNGSAIGSAVFYLRKTNSPTGNATAKIYAHSGTFGTSSVPTGAALATSDVFDVSTLTTSFQLITFDFSGGNQITLTNGTNYVVSIEYSVSGVPNSVVVGYDSSSATHAGNRSFMNSSDVWASTTNDLCFYVYDNGAAGVTLEVLVTPGIQQTGGVRIV